MTDDTPITGQPYADSDLVYVDPNLKIVVGKVAFKENGLPIPKEMPPAFAVAAVPAPADDEEPEAKAAEGAVKPAAAGKVKAGDGRPARKPRKRFYPWGTYKTMKKIYKIEGKVPEAERTLTLDDVMAKALQEPYWD